VTFEHATIAVIAELSNGAAGVDLSLSRRVQLCRRHGPGINVPPFLQTFAMIALRFSWGSSFEPCRGIAGLAKGILLDRQFLTFLGDPGVTADAPHAIQPTAMQRRAASLLPDFRLTGMGYLLALKAIAVALMQSAGR
jgi:hypothetical protein